MLLTVSSVNVGFSLESERHRSQGHFKI